MASWTQIVRRMNTLAVRGGVHDPTPADSILTRSRSMITTASEVTGEGTSLVCIYNAKINSLAHII